MKKTREEEIWSEENRLEHWQKKYMENAKKKKKSLRDGGHGEKSNISAPSLGRGNKRRGEK